MYVRERKMKKNNVKSEDIRLVCEIVICIDN